MALHLQLNGHLLLFGWQIPYHPVFEALAYGIGFRIYLLARPHSVDFVSSPDRFAITVCAILGALFGSKIPNLADAWALGVLRHTGWLSGKTVVGGFVGGMLAVEIFKRVRDIRIGTGDAYVFPLIFGLILGRLGCFLAGLPDLTHGNPSNLPWALDYGDGIPRHPAQLYEIFFLTVMGIVFRFGIRPRFPGLRFRIFLGLYLTYRFAMDFEKPYARPFWGLAGLQWACLVGIVVMILATYREKRASFKSNLLNVSK